MLKDWLVRALTGVFRRNAAVLTFRDLQTHAAGVSQCDKILAEALEGGLGCGIGTVSQEALGFVVLSRFQNPGWCVLGLRGAIPSHTVHPKLHYLLLMCCTSRMK